MKRASKAGLGAAAVLVACCILSLLSKKGAWVQVSRAAVPSNRTNGGCISSLVAFEPSAEKVCRGLRKCGKKELKDEDDFIAYAKLAYCTFDGSRLSSMPILTAWLAVLIYGAVWIADDYLCPSLAGLADLLELSPEVAGVTFLALGNGSPDISSTFASIASSSFHIAASELIGAAMFVTTVVVAAVAFVSDAELDGRAFQRNVYFLLGAVVGLVWITSRPSLTVYHALAFVLYYVCYLGVSLFPDYMRIRRSNTWSSLKSGNSLINKGHRDTHSSLALAGSIASSLDEYRNSTYDSFPQAATEEKGEDVDEHDPESPDIEALNRGFTALIRRASIRVVDTCSSALQAAFFIPQTPARHVLRFTVPPTVRPDDHWNWWARFTLATSAVTVPIFWIGLCFGFEVLLKRVFGLVPVCLPLGLVCTAVAIYIYRRTNNTEEPEPSVFLYLVGFISCVAWMFVLATEVVRVIKTIGLVMEIPPAVLGLTVLAWGNSVGDIISNTAIARQSSPKTAVAACFSSPMVNLVFSLGIALTLECMRRSPRNYRVVPVGAIFYNTAGFLCFGLVLTSILAAKTGYVIRRNHGKILVGLYVLCNMVNAAVLWFSR